MKQEIQRFMNIIVCVKQVIDPEAPPANFKVDATSKKVVLPADTPLVLDPYSEYALEAALKLKDKCGGSVTALSLGENLLREVIKKPLSMGADELILLEDTAFADGDSFSTAYALSMAIKKIGNYDLILCGRQSADWGSEQVGSNIASMLELPAVTLACKIEITDNGAFVERITDEGYEIIKAPLPVVINVSNEIGEPRYPTVRGIMAARKKEPIVWKPVDISVEPSQVGNAGRRSHLVKLFHPLHNSKCEFIEAETPEEAAVNLADRLKQEKLI
jgi:electron transfer flavoprotein beta subunit